MKKNDRSTKSQIKKAGKAKPPNVAKLLGLPISGLLGDPAWRDEESDQEEYTPLEFDPEMLPTQQQLEVILLSIDGYIPKD